MRHFPAKKAPSRIEGMSHARAPIFTKRHWLMFGTGFWVGVTFAAWFVLSFCQGGVR